MKVYMDHAATTPVDKRVLEAMLPYFTENYGNPSSIHKYGRETRKALDHSREAVVNILGGNDPREIVFTGSGSEADNLALFGAARSRKKKGNHIITSAIEHPAVLNTCKKMEKEGFEVTYLPVDEYGLISPEQVSKALTERTVLVSIMTANNEVGAVQPIAQIGEVLKDKDIVFHTDAVQAVGSIEVNVNDLGVDLLSLSAHKFYGPKGVGALYLRKGTDLEKLIHGGAQERNRRAGTENVPGIVGLAKALELAAGNMRETSEKTTWLRDYLIKEITGRISEVRLNGHPTKRLPGNTNFSFKYVEGESILLSLDQKGIAASSGSACSSGSLEPSHVLSAMGLDHETAHGSLRLTLGKDTTKNEVDYVVDVLEETIERLRSMSPLYPHGFGGGNHLNTCCGRDERRRYQS